MKNIELQKIYRLPQVEDLCGLSRATIYRQIRAGAFPRPVKIGRRAVGWKGDSLSAWQDGLKDGGRRR